MPADGAGLQIPGFRVRHAGVPGRTRLRADEPLRSSVLKAAADALLRDPRVHGVVPNHKVMSLLVEHDAQLAPEAVTEMVRAALSQRSTVGAARMQAPDLLPVQPAWHARSAKSVLKAQQTSLAGLTSDEAAARFALHGPNVLLERQPRSGAEIMTAQFRSLPVMLLLASAGLSIATGGLLEAVVTLAVVALNAGIGFSTESWTERMILRLSRADDFHIPVRRNGEVIEISQREVVVGDVLVLSAGVSVAADVRLLETDELALDESVLTGESYPARKDARARVAPNAPITARSNMAYRGGVVTGGHGEAVVVAVGQATEIGLVQNLLGKTRPPQAPMDRELDRLGVRLTVACIFAAVLVMALLRVRGAPMIGVLRSGIALAVSAIPEGLPAVSATAKAVTASALAKNGVLVRNLSVIQSAGAVDFLCLDKTGTLTQNRMASTVVRSLRARHAIDPDARVAHPPLGPDSSELARIAILCNDAEVRLGGEISGSGTEAALLALADAAGMDLRELRREAPRVDAWYRNRDRRYMATAHDSPNGMLIAVKGAPEEVLALCSSALIGGEAVQLTEALSRTIVEQNRELADEGLRVLGFARALGKTLQTGALEGLEWLGLVGLSDPLRPGAADLIACFQRAGIRTLILTGDQAATARTLASKLQLATDGSLDVVDASELDGLDSERIARIAESAEVFARVSPADKLKIVEALQAHGRIVLMTGDGVNDGPALRAAHIGVAMGQSGSQVAKDVADIVIADDGLEGLARFLAQGRSTERNIRRAVRFLLGTNLSETLLLVMEAARGPTELEGPLELLWLNLVTDVFPALGLSLAPPERDVLSIPPRSSLEPLFNRREYTDIGIDAAALSAAALASHLIGVARYGPGPAARGMTFLTLAGAQLWHVLAMAPARDRSAAQSSLGRWGVEAGVAASFAFLSAPYIIPALGAMIGIGRPRWTGLLTAFGLSAVPLVLSRIRRLAAGA